MVLGCAQCRLRFLDSVLLASSLKGEYLSFLVVASHDVIIAAGSTDGGSKYGCYLIDLDGKVSWFGIQGVDSYLSLSILV